VEKLKGGVRGMTTRLFFKLLFVALAFSMAFQAEVGAEQQTIPPKPVKPMFSTATVDNLRNTMKNIRPVRLTAGAITMETMPFSPVAGKTAGGTTIQGTVANPYASPQGLVLSILRPQDATTHSEITEINWALYTPEFRAQLAANDPQTSVYSVLSWQTYNSNQLAFIKFEGLPSGKHTYVLSVGSSVPVDNLVILDWSTGKPLLTGPQLVSNPTTSEVRGLLALDQRSLTVLLKVNKPVTTIFGAMGYYFHHIQMTCLDCQ
jgi:hypothetical protein